MDTTELYNRGWFHRDIESQLYLFESTSSPSFPESWFESCLVTSSNWNWLTGPSRLGYLFLQLSTSVQKARPKVHIHILLPPLRTQSLSLQTVAIFDMSSLTTPNQGFSQLESAQNLKWRAESIWLISLSNNVCIYTMVCRWYLHIP